MEATRGEMLADVVLRKLERVTNCLQLLLELQMLNMMPA